MPLSHTHNTESVHVAAPIVEMRNKLNGPRLGLINGYRQSDFERDALMALDCAIPPCVQSHSSYARLARLATLLSHRVWLGGLDAARRQACASHPGRAESLATRCSHSARATGRSSEVGADGFINREDEDLLTTS
jgi:hypothetical protein